MIFTGRLFVRIFYEIIRIYRGYFIVHMIERELEVILKINLFIAFMLVSLNSLSETIDSSLDKEIIKGLESGKYFLILRHAFAPGNGDPEHFDISDCQTQRNLSDKGRIQARNIGEFLKKNGIDKASVFTSQWCRCRETAELMDIGSVKDLPVMNSFFRDFEKEEEQTLGLIKWLVNERSNVTYPLILVTHQVNITALTGVFPSSGEIVVMSLDNKSSIQVVDRITTL